MVFIYVTNRIDFGHLVNPETFDTTLTNPEMYQLMDNRWDWEQRYLHPNYSENFNPEFKVPMVKLNIKKIYLSFCKKLSHLLFIITC